MKGPRKYPPGSYCVVADHRLVDDPDSETEFWRAHRESVKARRDERLPERIAEIMALQEAGHSVRAVTEHQYRVDGLVDLYPARRRFVVVSGPRVRTVGNYRAPADALGRAR